MPLTKAQCTNCGIPYIVEKAINNYQTINTYNINNAVTVYCHIAGSGFVGSGECMDVVFRVVL